jgi:hypothetical protein
MAMAPAFKTTDSGLRWSALRPNPPIPIRDITVILIMSLSFNDQTEIVRDVEGLAL